jgi:hypothetical protein
MFWKAKYIIADGNIPIVFAEVITHADMARNIGAKSDQIVGAGFVTMGTRSMAKVSVCRSRAVAPMTNGF